MAAWAEERPIYLSNVLKSATRHFKQRAVISHSSGLGSVAALCSHSTSYLYAAQCAAHCRGATARVWREPDYASSFVTFTPDRKYPRLRYEAPVADMTLPVRSNRSLRPDSLRFYRSCIHVYISVNYRLISTTEIDENIYFSRQWNIQRKIITHIHTHTHYYHFKYLRKIKIFH